MLAFLRHIVLATGLVLALSTGPLGVAAQSVTSAAQSDAVAAQSVTSAAQSVTSAAQSVTGAAQSVTSAAQSVTSAAQPVTSAAQSVTSAAQSVTLAAQSVTVAAQSQTTTFPLTITDDSGVASTFAAPPQRIISLSPGLTEITYAVGAGSRLVAVDSFSDYPPEAKTIQPRLITYPAPSIETIVSLKPDVVLSLAERDDDVAQIRRQGIPVLKLLPRDFDAAVRTIGLLGRLYGNSQVADGIASDMLARRDAVVAAVADAERPRVYEELDASEPDKPFVAGPNGFYGQLIDVAGGINVFGDLPGDVGQVGAESIVERNPDVIILTDADLPFNPQTPEMVAARPGWDTITAVQNGAVYPVPGDIYSTPGPRLILGLEAMAKLLHPDRFPDS